MSIDSEFDRAITPEMTPEQRKEAQLRVLLTNARMTIAQLSEFAVMHKATDKRLDKIEIDLADNTKVTREVRELLDTFKGGMKVLGWLGTGMKWAGSIAAAVFSIYAAWHAFRTGNFPGGK